MSFADALIRKRIATDNRVGEALKAGAFAPLRKAIPINGGPGACALVVESAGQPAGGFTAGEGPRR